MPESIWEWATVKKTEPDELEDPGTYVMPFGKHKGRTLKSIDRSQRGHDYLLWCMNELDAENVVDAIKDFLSSK